MLTFLAVSIHGLIYAQFNLNAYFTTARNDIEIDDIQKRLEYLDEFRINTPVINRVEFRTRARNLNFTQQEYRLRFTPTNPLEIIRNSEYQKLQINSLNNDLKFSLNTALKIRYQLIIN